MKKTKQRSGIQPGDVHAQSGTANSSFGRKAPVGKWKPLYSYLLLIGLILIVYGQTIPFGYTGFDDEILVRDNRAVLKNISSIGSLVLTDVSMGKSAPQFYRPLQMMTYMFDTILGGGSPKMCHLTNVLLHCVICCSLLYLLLYLRFHWGVALFFSALFAVHPVYAQSVAWIPSRGDLLISVFAIWMFIFYRKYYYEGKLLHLLLLEICYLLAIFSKETAAVFPLILLVYSLLERKGKVNWKRISVAGIPIAVIFGCWFLLRNKVITPPIETSIAGIGPMLKNLPAIPTFISKFFIPVGLAPMPAFTTFSSITGSVLLVALIIAGITLKKNRDPYFLFGLFWFFIFLFPALWYRHEMGGQAYDYLIHRLYLPAVGLTLALISIFPREKFKPQKWLIFIAVALIAAGGAASAMLVRHYSDPVTFDDYAVAMNPISAVAWNNRGNHRSIDGNPEGAISDFTEAIRLVPDYIRALNNRGMALKKLGRLSEALADFTEAMKLYTPTELEYFNQGSLYYQLGNFSEAEHNFDKAIAMKPTYAHALNGRGLIKNVKGDMAGAISDYSEAIRNNPKLAEAYLNRGNAYTNMKKLREAEEDYDAAIRLKPDLVIAYVNLANLRADAGRRSEALQLFTKAVQMNPSSPDGYVGRGLFKFKGGDKAGALADFNEAIRVAPRSIEAYNDKGMVHESIGDYKNAYDDFTDAIKISPAFALAYKNRGVILYKQGNIKAACEDWEQAVKYGETDAVKLLQQNRK